jgi:hypothetical protein
MRGNKLLNAGSYWMPECPLTKETSPRSNAMIRWLQWSVFGTLFAALVLITGPGCNPPPKKDPAAAKDKGKEKDKDNKKDDHDHAEIGPHGGVIVEWPPYHGELFVDHAGKQATVYVLDEKAEKAPDIEAKRFSKVKLTLTDEKPPTTIDFALDEKKSSKDTIAFSATHDAFAKKTVLKGELSARLDDDNPKKVTPFNGPVTYDPKEVEEKKKK